MDVVQILHDTYYDDDYEFSYKDGFNIAAAFTAYDNEEERTLDPSYGELVFEVTEWGNYPNGTYFYNERRIETHECTRTELGLDQD